jgi:GTP-binding protein EngB required for normal cell division
MDYRFLLNEEYEIGNLIKIPEVIFVGMQTSGKSSIIEAIVGLPFNFTGTGMATRVPLEITTTSVYPAPSDPVWNLNYNHKSSKISNVHLSGISTLRVCDELKNIHAKLSNQNSVSRNPVSLHLHWEKAHNLKFVDLPGFKGNCKDKTEEILQQEIFEINRDIISSKSDEIFVIVEPACSDSANYFAHQIFKNIVQDYELNKSVILVCSKFDLVQDIQELNKYLTEYMSCVSKTFVLSCPHGDNVPKNDYSDMISRFHVADCDRVGNSKFPWINTEFGINNFIIFLEKILDEQLINSIPRIKKNLENKIFENDQQCIKYQELRKKSVCQWIQQFLNSEVVDFGIKMIQAWDAKNLDCLDMRTREEEESMVIKSDENFDAKNKHQFNYKSSAIWQNKEYQVKTKSLLLYDWPLAGSAQIRRILREFEISLFTRVMKLDENFKSSLQNKIFSIRTSDGSCTSWNEVIVELIKDMSKTFLKSDIQFLHDSVKVILMGWGESIINSKDIPNLPTECIMKALQNILTKILSNSFEKMDHFIVSAIVTSVYRPIPTAGSTIAETYELCTSFYSKDFSSEVNRGLGDIGITVTDIQVGKAKRYCMQRLNLGVSVISQTLGAIFDSFFTCIFRNTLIQELTTWEKSYTDKFTKHDYDEEIQELEIQNEKISNLLLRF